MSYKHFYILQRITSLYIFAIGIYYLFFGVSLQDLSLSDKVFGFWFYLCLLIHTYIGLHTVIDDYLKGGIKLVIGYLINISLLTALFIFLDFLWK